MKKVLLFVFAMIAFGSVQASAAPDVCTQQIMNYVENNLHTNVVDITYEDICGNESCSGSRAWVTVASCGQYIVFNLRASMWECNMGHYGPVPNYITQVWAYGSCHM